MVWGALVFGEETWGSRGRRCIVDKKPPRDDSSGGFVVVEWRLSPGRDDDANGVVAKRG